MPAFPSARPIEEYAFLGDCVTGALLNADGGIDWLCLPALDAPSFFGALLDAEKGGEWIVRPRGVYRVERAYLEDSAVIITRFHAESGVVRVTDFFVLARDPGAIFSDYTTLAPTRKLVRLVEHESGGVVPMEMRVRARPDYARAAIAGWEPSGPASFRCPLASLTSDTGVVWRDGDLFSLWDATPGSAHFAVLDYGDERPTPALADARRWLAVTTAFWEEWHRFNHYRGPHAAAVRRSATTLKLLTHAPTGAIAAAATTSLPEVPHGKSNWDYRFSWVRDTAFFINALFRVGYSGEATQFLKFVVQQTMEMEKSGKKSGGVVAVLHGIRPESITEEQTLDNLAGYDGARPVHVGNHAAQQFQLDNNANLLEAFFYYQSTGGTLDADMKKLAGRAAKELMARWREPDNGVWEAGEKACFTHGKAVAWSGLMAAAEFLDLPREELEECCRAIRVDVLAHGMRGEGDGLHLVACYEHDDVDAASLVAGTNGFLPLDLARATRRRIERELGTGVFLHRNPMHKKEGEGAFLLCMWWRISHLVREGEQARAEDLLERTLALQSPFGLLAEEIDPANGRFLGNFPQAFSHLGLIAAVTDVEYGRRETGPHGLPDRERFVAKVGDTVGIGAAAGFWRAPGTIPLVFSSRSKWEG